MTVEELVLKKLRDRGNDARFIHITYGPDALTKSNEELADMIIEAIDKAQPIDFDDSCRKCKKNSCQEKKTRRRSVSEWQRAFKQVKESSMSSYLTKREIKSIVSGLRSGRSFRDVAASVGVHHRTAQRVADRHGVFSARSPLAIEEDFNKKGRKVYYAVRGLNS